MIDLKKVYKDNYENLKKALCELETEKKKKEDEINLLLKTPKITRKTRKGVSFTRKLLAVDIDYPDYLDIIFSHGKTNYKIWFLNNKNKLCLITKCEKIKGVYFVSVLIDAQNRHYFTRMSLDRFLYLVEIGDFKITSDKFNYYYMKPYDHSLYLKSNLCRLKSEISALNSQIYRLQADIEELEYKI